MTARVVNGGKAVKPVLVRSIEGDGLHIPPAPDLGFKKAHLDLVRRGMEAVVNSPGGTAQRSAIKEAPYSMGGKTGSAQVRRITMAQRKAGLNTDTLPKVLVNRTYYARISKAARSLAEKGYLLDCLQTANWLVKSLDQRARTILRVAGEIVRLQDAFLTYGVQYLRPLNLKTVAEAVGMHESTISRVTTNKYVHTPQGLFELKYFFNSSIRRVAEEDIASESVKQSIKKIIDGEDKQNPLSDQQIVEMLAKRDGIQIARRTVAKYRDQLGVLSARMRKRI